MKLLVFILLLIPGFAHAEYVCPGTTNPYSSLFDLSNAMKLDWWSVSPEQVLSAPCKNQAPPSDQAMLDALKPSSLAKTSETINGIAFKDEDPRLLQLFRDLHTYDVTKNGAAPLNFKSSCTKVLCAAQEIYGKREGVQILYMLKRFGFNGSHLRTTQASAWKNSELDDIITSLSDYPDELYPLDYNRKLVHFTRGNRMKIPEGESVANSTMEIYDMWNDLTRAERQQSILHELGHVVARKDNVDDSAAWYKVSGWRDKTKAGNGKTNHDFELTDPSKAVSQYGMTNPHEDFAESVVKYRFDGANMKTKYPEKYAFLKDRVFDGKEYLTAESCKISKSRTEDRKEVSIQAYKKVLATAQRKAGSYDSKTVAQAKTLCLDTLVKSMTGELGSSQNCTSRALQRLTLEKAAKSKGLKLDGSLLSDDQIDAVSLKDGAQASFNKDVRTQMAKEILKAIPSSERSPQDSGLFKSASNPTEGCAKWASFAQSSFSNGDITKPLLEKDKYYFYSEKRYERVASFLSKSCLRSVDDNQRLDSSIVQNLP